jgi:hypothetical protein
MVGTTRRPSLHLAREAAVMALLLACVPRFDSWAGVPADYFVLWVTLGPALGCGRAAEILRWPTRVRVLCFGAGIGEGMLLVIGSVLFSNAFGAEPGHSVAEAVVAWLPAHVTLPIDGGLFVALLVLVALALIVWRWRRAKEDDRAERASLAAWATERGLPADTSE